MSFEGVPVAALDFYDDLEVENTKAFWEAHKQTYRDDVRAPMVALTDALADEFGEAKVFRPHRDVRFSKDKTPYKTHQGAFVGVGPASGWYVEVAAPGVRIGGGVYHAAGERLAALREGMADEDDGALLLKILEDLERGGFSIEGERLKTAPRGYPTDHPRIELLRHKTLLGTKSYGFEEFHPHPGTARPRPGRLAPAPSAGELAGRPPGELTTCLPRGQAEVKDAIVRSGSQKAFIDVTRPSSSTT